MKIGIVCYPTFGGSGVVATELGMALADKGHEIHFITYNQPVRLDFLSHHLHFHQVVVEEYPLFEYQPYELALSSKMVEIVEKHQLEVLHVHYAIPHAYAAYMAKQMLKEKGISVKVVNIHSIKPIDKKIIIESSNKTEAVLCVEEHQLNGGLGDIIGSVIMEKIEKSIIYEKMGIDDEFCEYNGSYEGIKVKYKMTKDDIVNSLLNIYKRKNEKK